MAWKRAPANRPDMSVYELLGPGDWTFDAIVEPGMCGGRLYNSDDPGLVTNMMAINPAGKMWDLRLFRHVAPVLRWEQAWWWNGSLEHPTLCLPVIDRFAPYWSGWLRDGQWEPYAPMEHA